MNDQSNIIDRVFAYVSPEKALKRERARNTLDQLRKYDGGSRNKRTEKWFTPDRSVNNDIQDALPIMRLRVRDLYQNEPYITKAINTVVNKVVGRGIVPAINVPKQQALESRIQSEFKSWAKKCDWSGHLPFFGIQRMIIRTVAMTGEAIVLKRIDGRDVSNPLRLQVFGGEHIDMSKSIPLDNGGYILNGVEFDGRGMKVAIWLFPILPQERYIFRSIASKRFPMTDCVHLFHKVFPDQVRGIPFGTSSIIKSRDFNEFEDAELVRQKISACFVAFVHDISDNGTPSSGDEDEFEKVAPGIIEKLPPGKTVSFGTPPVNNSYHLYAKQVLHGMASGYGTSYESMTGDYSEVNFSSARMGAIEMMEQMAEYQDDVMIHGFCTSIFEWFVQIMATKYPKMESGIDVSWTPPKKIFVDPVKEGKAMADLVRDGLDSWSNSVRSLGRNPEELANEIAKDREMMKKLNIKVLTDPTHAMEKKESSVAPAMKKKDVKKSGQSK